MTYKEWEQIGFASKEDAWNASRKNTLEEMKSRLEIKGANEWLGWEFLNYIDTEIEKLNDLMPPH